MANYLNGPFYPEHRSSPTEQDTLEKRIRDLERTVAALINTVLELENLVYSGGRRHD